MRVSTRPAYRVLACVAFAFAAFWNLVVGLAAADLLHAGRLGLLFGVFLLPFALVGLGLFAAAGYLLAASLHPSLRLGVDRDEYRRGDPVVVSWSFDTAPSRLERFDLALQVVETLIEGSGDDETRHAETLFESTIASAVPLRGRNTGTIRLTLPLHVEPATADGEREVTWQLFFRAEGRAPWPDLRFWLPIVVRW